MADVQDGQDPLQGAGPDAHRSRNGVRSYLALPLRVKGKVVGALGLDHALPNFYGPKEVELASAFAHQVAAGIENARLFSESRKLAVVEERGRLARDLHDSVTQMLYSLTLFAEAARRALLAEDRPLAEEHLARLRETARQSLKEMRLLVFQLRTSPLEGHSLSDALEARLDAVEKRAGVEAELALEGAQRLSPAAQDELYWIAQEALNNALKHSAADQVQLRLRVTSAGAEFEISDNGRGFDPSRARSGGMGLGSLRERAVRLGGRVEVDSAPRAGTRIRVHLGQPALADLPREAAPHD
jgi:signal transduction histidine kinase